MRKRKKKNLSNDDRSIFFSFRLYILYLIVLLYFRSLCTRDEKRKKKRKKEKKEKTSRRTQNLRICVRIDDDDEAEEALVDGRKQVLFSTRLMIIFRRVSHLRQS